MEGLTAGEAAWAPAPARHSIWQIVLHVVFWREDALRRLTDPRQPTEDDLARLNFPAIPDASGGAWSEARRRLADSQARIAAVLRDPGSDIERIMYMLPHDCSHMGQINYLRALRGLQPID